jgi:hypothetical protein
LVSIIVAQSHFWPKYADKVLRELNAAIDEADRVFAVKEQSLGQD